MSRDIDDALETHDHPNRGFVFGVAGFVLSVLALGTTLIGPSIIEANEPPPEKLSKKVVDFGADVLKEIKDRAAGKEPPPPPAPQGIDREQILRIAVMLAALCGIVLGVIAWSRREDHRLAAAAAAIGVLTIGWEYIFVGIVLGVCLAILFFLLVHFGLDLPG